MGIREALLAAAPPTEVVQIPELSIAVTVRGMSGAERDAFEVSLLEGRGAKREVAFKNVRAKLVAFCCIDEQGQRVFTDEDAAALGEMRADILNRLYVPAQRLSGLSEVAADTLGKP